LPDPTLGHMNEVVKGAVNICSGVYIAVGLFGNIACSGLDLGGDSNTVKPLNVIALGQRESDNINQMITISNLLLIKVT
jgi:hypothetical protein